MREIKIFNCEPQYSFGDLTNILELREKLQKDEQILSKIELDFKKDNAHFKEEYRNAKIVHLCNNQLYYWLILKYYYEQAFFSDSNYHLSVDYQKEQMKSNGWVFPIQFASLRITRTGAFEGTTDQAYVDYFNNYFDDLFNIVIGDEEPRINRHYRQAISSYKNKNYYSCVVSLFPIIESLHQTITKFNEDDYYHIKEHLSNFSNEVKNIKQIYTIEITYFTDLVKQINDLIKNHYFNRSLSRKKEPLIINRNRIMHGLFTRDISMRDCLQLFCVISNMSLLYEMIKISKKLDDIPNQISELKRE